MVDQGNARRRHHNSSSFTSKTESRTFRTEIRSGGSSDAEDDIDYNQSRQTNQITNSPTRLHRNYSKHRTKKRRRRRRRDENDPPFVILFLQVGAVLLTLCVTSLHVYRHVFPSVETYGEDDQYYYVPNEVADALTDKSIDNDNDNDPNTGYGSDYRKEQELKLYELLRADKDEDDTSLSDKLQTGKKRDNPNKKAEEVRNETMPPLPEFPLSQYANWDAFGIFETMKKIDKNSEDNRDSKGSRSTFWQEARSMRMQFAELYGGENAARMLLDRGTTTFPIIPISNDTNSADVGDSDTAGSTKVNKIPFEPPSDVVATACRLHQAKTENRPFRMAFGGYSVTAGRGNKHQDSYPFQLKNLLEPMLKAAGFSPTSPLSVTNAAIGGVPSFPYGWCMIEFWGGGNDTKEANDNSTAGIPDVVSWDFGMNEASGGPEGLEAYIRQLISIYSHQARPIPPKLIVKDYFTASYRKQVLAQYSYILKDPVLLHTDHALEPIFDVTKGSGKDYDEKEDWRRPLGFRNWREWGAPKGAPGQANHHPAVQEHKLNGWILAMHFITALEYMVAMEEENTGTTSHWCPLATLQKDHNKKPHSAEHSTSLSRFSLPPPVSRNITNNTDLPYDGIFFGYPVETTDNDGSNKNSSNSTFLREASSPSRPWRMNPIRCRTTFEPKFSGDLSGIVVSGTMGEDLDPTLPKSQYYYNEGWTYDLSEAEKSAKRKLNLYPESLGFRDSKEAYYGIYESPPMTLLLPYGNDAQGGDAVSTSMPKVDDPAADWYKSIVICQVNDKNTFDSAFADPNSCSFAKDVAIRIGGVDLNQNATRMLNTIGSVYLGKPICKHVAIPSLARLTSHNTLLLREEGGKDQHASRSIVTEDGRNSINSRLLETDQMGVLVEIFVSNPHIVHVNQACSISHVVWEEITAGQRP